MRNAESNEPAAEWVSIDELRPWSQNPRNNKQAIDRVVESIRRFGFGAPILARHEDHDVIAGHTRLAAAKKLGLAKVPVRYLDLDPADAHLLALADNRLGEIATWDDDALSEILRQLKAEGAELDVAGFSSDELDKLLRDTASIEAVAAPDPGAGEVPDAAQSERGEEYELGPHRLLCGDATVVTDLERVVGGTQVDAVFTDPPYNVDYKGGTEEGLTIANDNMESGAFRSFLRDAFASMLTVAKPGAAIYVCHADSEGENFRGALRESGWLLKQCLIWVKDQFVMGRQDYHWQHEPILYGWAPGAAHSWHGDRKQSTTWNFDRPRRNGDHPTMKPIELVEYALSNSTKKGDVVLDPFGGSGTTLIACARLGRAARLVELDPRYCDVIRRRWTTFAKSARVDPGTGALE